MAVVDPVIYESLVTEITEDPNIIGSSWKCRIFSPGKPSITAMDIEDIDYNCNFISSIGDEIVVTLKVTVAEYTHYIYPNRRNLKLALTRKMESEQGTLDLVGVPQDTKEYDATLINQIDLDMQALPSMDESSQLMTVVIQLMHPAITKLRTKTSSGTFFNEVPGDVTKVLAGIATKTVGLTDDNSMLGVDMVPVSNKAPRKHVIIPNGIPTMEMPGYVQKYAGGIYNSGIGSYIRNRHWFIYPIYDTTRYSKATRTLEVIVVPPNRMPHIERTYVYGNYKLKVLCTTEIQQRDNTDVNYQNSGNGVRFFSATKTMENFATIKGNVLDINRIENENVIGVDQRASDQYLPFSDQKFTDNKAHQISKLSGKKGEVLSIVWNNSNGKLLTPGMPVKLYYGSGQGFSSPEGVLLGYQENTSKVNGGVINKYMRSTLVLSVFVKS